MHKTKVGSLELLKTIVAILSVPRYFFLLVVFTLPILFVFLWLFNFSQIITILQTVPSELPVVLIEGYFNLFLYGVHFVPIMLVLIALTTSLALVIAKFIRDNSEKTVNNNYLPLVLGAFGAGCVACGGSVLSPILTITGLASVVTLASAITYGFLILALAVCLYSVFRMGEQASHILINAQQE